MVAIGRGNPPPDSYRPNLVDASLSYLISSIFVGCGPNIQSNLTTTAQSTVVRYIDIFARHCGPLLRLDAHRVLSSSTWVSMLSLLFLLICGRSTATAAVTQVPCMP